MMARRVPCSLLLVVACSMGAAAELVAQTRLSIGATSITLTAPDTTAYGSGLSIASAAISVSFPANNPCPNNPGCSFFVVRSATASVPGIEVDIQLDSNPAPSGSGATCDEVVGLAPAWHQVTSSPLLLVNSNRLNGSRSCSFTIRVRARGLDYAVQQYVGTYFRDIQFTLVQQN